MTLSSIDHLNIKRAIEGHGLSTQWQSIHTLCLALEQDNNISTAKTLLAHIATRDDMNASAFIAPCMRILYGVDIADAPVHERR